MVNQTENSPRTSNCPAAFEVRDFIRLRRNGSLVPVRHYRTVYGQDGRVAVEALSVRPLLQRAIADFGGEASDGGEAVTGRFASESAARACAEAISRYQGWPVQVSGGEVTVLLEGEAVG
jgi:hypothetical protein